ncbi:hypothetical protein JYJ95_18490 [Corallococcus exiguus]|nr:hypothetical protein [Corallococcus exiguus]MBN8468508.1 hypothetical protein [Corallococcus exiguus]
MHDWTSAEPPVAAFQRQWVRASEQSEQAETSSSPLDSGALAGEKQA